MTTVELSLIWQSKESIYLPESVQYCFSEAELLHILKCRESLKELSAAAIKVNANNYEVEEELEGNSEEFEISHLDVTENACYLEMSTNEGTVVQYEFDGLEAELKKRTVEYKEGMSKELFLSTHRVITPEEFEDMHVPLEDCLESEDIKRLKCVHVFCELEYFMELEGDKFYVMLDRTAFEVGSFEEMIDIFLKYAVE